MRVTRIVVGVLATLTLFLGCLFDGKDPEPQRPETVTSYVSFEISAPQQMLLNQSAPVTIKYAVNYPSDRSDTLEWVAPGYFFDLLPSFSIVSGDSSWVDTVMSSVEVEHSVVIKALRRGTYSVQAGVSTPKPPNVFGWGASTNITVE